MSIRKVQEHFVIGCVRVMVGFSGSKVSKQFCMSSEGMGV